MPLFKAVKQDYNEMNCFICAKRRALPFPLLRSPPKQTDTYTAAAQHANGAMASLLTTGTKVLTAQDAVEKAFIMPCCTLRLFNRDLLSLRRLNPL